MTNATDNPILAISERAAALRAAGIDVISLAAGEPLIATGQAALAAAETAIRDPVSHHYGAAAGLPELRGEIARRYSDGTVASAAVQIALGSKHALHLALMAVLRPDDEVLLIRPTWPGHLAAVAAAGARSVTVASSPDGLIDLELLQQARTARTRAVLVANPANPSGTVHSAHRIAELGRWCSQYDIWLISDEIYSGLRYDGRQALAWQAVAHHRRVIVVDGVSKSHAMTGWRVGWLVAPDHVIAAARKRVADTITNVPMITQYAALAALRDRAAAQRTTDYYQHGRDLLVERLRSVPGIRCPLPAGGMFAFPDVSGLLEDSRWTSSAHLADWLLEQARVAVVPGEVFGVTGHLRISFAVEHHLLAEAASRLAVCLGSG